MSAILKNLCLVLLIVITALWLGSCGTSTGIADGNNNGSESTNENGESGGSETNNDNGESNGSDSNNENEESGGNETSSNENSSDTTAPVLSITSPGTSDTTGYNLTGTAEDDVAVTSISYNLNGGESQVIIPVESPFSLEITLVEGDNMIIVTAEDAAGNKVTDQISVTFTLSVDNSQEALTADDLLQGAPESLATESIPAFYPDPALPSDYVVANADGLVAGLEVHKSHLIVKINNTSTTEEVNNLFESVRVKVAGTAGPGLVYVELTGNPTQDNLVQAMAALKASPAIDTAVEDILVEYAEGGEIATALMNSACDGGSEPRASEWTGTYFGGDGNRAWFRTFPSGNWWLEFIRMPAVWNFNDAIQRRSIAESRLPEELSPPIGVVDVGFQTHADLPLINNAGLIADCHGNMVAGVIAATHDKHGNADGSKGMEGVHPFTRIMDSVVSMIMDLKLAALFSDEPEDIKKLKISQMEIITSIKSMLDDHPNTRVVNISYGINWKKCLQDTANPCAHPNNSVLTNVLFRKYAQLAWETINHHDVLITSAAGNSSDLVAISYGAVEAKWVSPLNYLALEGFFDNNGNEIKADNIMVVEAVGWHDLGGRRYFASSTGGQIAAPGMCMTSTSLSDGYSSKSGTSFAAPIIAGLAGYLWSIDPRLTVAEVKEAIIGTAWPMGSVTNAPMYVRSCSTIDDLPNHPATLVAHPGEPDQPPIVDAYSAVMTLDRAAEMLVDADDGTVDGAMVTGSDADKILPGDGRIDMADFRAFRDAVLQLRSVTLDPPILIKRDNNRDGCVYDGATCTVREEIWSRFDFNGDGKLSEMDTAGLWLPDDPRDMAQPQRTDLYVLRSVWPGNNVIWEKDCGNRNNPLSEGWCETDLPGLIDSRDLIVDFSAFAPELNEEIEVSVTVGNHYKNRVRIFDHESEPLMVFTIPHDPDCAASNPVDNDCYDYMIFVIAKTDSMVRAGSVNLYGSGATAQFHNLDPGTDEIVTIHPDVVVTLDRLTGAATETVMTATATYSDAVELINPESGTRRDFFWVTRGTECFRFATPPCVTDSVYTRTDTSLTYSFIPNVAGMHTLHFEIYTPYCEETDPLLCTPLTFLPRNRNLPLDFFVTDSTTPEPEPDPGPDPVPDDLPPYPEPEPLPPRASWSITDPVSYEIDSVCDEAAGTMTVTRSGTRHRIPTKSNPSWVESFSDTRTTNVNQCNISLTARRTRGYNSVTYSASSSKGLSSRAYYGGPQTVHIKKVVNGQRAKCSARSGFSDDIELCYDAVWRVGRNKDGTTYGYYEYKTPEEIYPEYPPYPEF